MHTFVQATVASGSRTLRNTSRKTGRNRGCRPRRRGSGRGIQQPIVVFQTLSVMDLLECGSLKGKWSTGRSASRQYSMISSSRVTRVSGPGHPGPVAQPVTLLR